MQVCLAHEAYFIHALAYLIHSPELPQAGTGPAEPLKSPASESCGATRTARLEGSSWGRGPTGPTPWLGDNDFYRISSWDLKKIENF